MQYEGVKVSAVGWTTAGIQSERDVGYEDWNSADESDICEE